MAYKYRKTFVFDGKRYDVKANSLEELYTKMINKQRDLEADVHRITSSMTVADWVEVCIESYKPNVSAEYRDQILRRLRRHLCSQIGTLSIRNVKPVQLQAVLNSQAGFSDSHLKKLHQDIRFVFRKARQNHLIAEDPSEDLVRPVGYKHTRRSLTDHEREHFLLVCASDPRFVLFELMLFCGCRSSEAYHVQGMDIQLDRGTPVLHIRGTKTANADRFVPLPVHLYERIKGTPPFEYVARTAAGTPFNKTSYRRAVERLRREMNISMGARLYRNQLVEPLPRAPDFVPYMLRHTYCTDLQKKGVDIRTAQYLMGHSDISITANIYTHVDMDQIRAAAALLDVESGKVSTSVSTF